MSSQLRVDFYRKYYAFLNLLLPSRYHGGNEHQTIQIGPRIELELERAGSLFLKLPI